MQDQCAQHTNRRLHPSVGRAETICLRYQHSHANQMLGVRDFFSWCLTRSSGAVVVPAALLFLEFRRLLQLLAGLGSNAKTTTAAHSTLTNPSLAGSCDTIQGCQLRGHSFDRLLVLLALNVQGSAMAAVHACRWAISLNQRRSNLGLRSPHVQCRHLLGQRSKCCQLAEVTVAFCYWQRVLCCSRPLCVCTVHRRSSLKSALATHTHAASQQQAPLHASAQIRAISCDWLCFRC